MEEGAHSCKNNFNNFPYNTSEDSYDEFPKESLNNFEKDKHVYSKVSDKSTINY